MSKSYYSLGLMSGTSMDGVDASVIQTDGKSKYKAILDKYFEYPKTIYNNLTTLRDKIKSSKDLKKHQKQIKSVEKEITIFHAKAVKETLKKTKVNVNFIGFHGQTIYHNAEEKISEQLGDGKLLSEITKKTVVYDFRQSDIENGGEGAPLTPIYHLALIKELFNENKVKIPISILNIGGIANITEIDKDFKITSRDIGPGNCLIDMWVRKNSNKLFDENGDFARKGKTDKFIFNQFLDNFHYSKINSKRSLDTNDFDISFAKGLSLENGTATITDLTSELLSKKVGTNDIYICGGGRKNKSLIKSLKRKIINNIFSIDDLNIDGDFIESQAFAFLAIRSYFGLPISFPSTTNCKEPSVGGTIIKNFN